MDRTSDLRSRGRCVQLAAVPLPMTTIDNASLWLRKKSTVATVALNKNIHNTATQQPMS